MSVKVPVVVNLYDLVIEEVSMAKLNTVTIPLGFGAFHSGVQVFGKEYSFKRCGMTVCPEPTVDLINTHGRCTRYSTKNHNERVHVQKDHTTW